MIEQYDVFISCRITDDFNHTTTDAEIARDVHDFLVSRGIRSFFSETSLVEIGQTEYKKVIDEVLDKVIVMVVVATSHENLESEWVRYEWDSFYGDILSGVKKGTLISYLEGVDFKALPRTLRRCQAIQHTENSLPTLFSYISSALGLKNLEDITLSGQRAVARLNQLIEIMAESRLLELEITFDSFGNMFSQEQRKRMLSHIDSLKRILKEDSKNQKSGSI